MLALPSHESKPMSEPGKSIFRNALQVSHERVAAMSDDDLNKFMAQLLNAQARRCGSPVGEIRTNTQGKAKDDGCDGWSDKPGQADEWFGADDTCWQFKAGAAGEPARLVGEVAKPIPRRTLSNGGRFVVVASGSTNGLKGERDRRATLIDDASRAGIATDKIEVIGSERLAAWCLPSSDR